MQKSLEILRLPNLDFRFLMIITFCDLLIWTDDCACLSFFYQLTIYASMQWRLGNNMFETSELYSDVYVLLMSRLDVLFIVAV